MQNEIGSDAAVLGHSMGGKVAMNFALNYPDRLAQLIVVDIAPRAYEPHHRDLLDGLRALDVSTFSTRADAEEALAAVAPEDDTRLFLLKNLYRTDDNSFAWRLNLSALHEHLAALGAEITGPGNPVPQAHALHPRRALEVHFLRRQVLPHRAAIPQRGDRNRA